jgi:ABC-type spermidine/putrescine transport system permease subunit I
MDESLTTQPFTEKLNPEQQISSSYDYPEGFAASLLLVAVLTVMIVALLLTSGFGREASD